MEIYKVTNQAWWWCFKWTHKQCEDYIKKHKLSRASWSIKLDSETARKFAALESQKNEIWRVFKVAVFIDIQKEKLYLIKENWERDYIF